MKKCPFCGAWKEPRCPYCFTFVLMSILKMWLVKTFSKNIGKKC